MFIITYSESSEEDSDNDTAILSELEKKRDKAIKENRKLLKELMKVSTANI